MVNENKITAIILAGGKSSRMGTDKGLLDFEGNKLIQHVIDNVKSSCEEILVVSNNDGYNSLGYPVVKDRFLNRGPLGGIHAGLSITKTNWNFVIGCDMPFAEKHFIAYLLSHVSKNSSEAVYTTIAKNLRDEVARLAV